MQQCKQLKIQIYVYMLEKHICMSNFGKVDGVYQKQQKPQEMIQRMASWVWKGLISVHPLCFFPAPVYYNTLLGCTCLDLILPHIKSTGGYPLTGRILEDTGWNVTDQLSIQLHSPEQALVLFSSIAWCILLFKLISDSADSLEGEVSIWSPIYNEVRVQRNSTLELEGI